ncbi:unnamed protein product [Acanthoscelides obtectus]|uniref:Uncharacterized protein n=1 Tax=Acanthoscelides obtectus TaxID=200917 RepID=A0A9P0M186_ACAOB|nr:unnamed protein product [Acanthoscelides obtectus]CAK1664854.1 hypothetical protein AOBTE_LOCUS24509 [Acanthoscelides obtectus]
MLFFCRYGIVKSIHCDLGNARLQNRHFPVSVPRKPGSTKNSHNTDLLINNPFKTQNTGHWTKMTETDKTTNLNPFRFLGTHLSETVSATPVLEHRLYSSLINFCNIPYLPFNMFIAHWDDFKFFTVQKDAHNGKNLPQPQQAFTPKSSKQKLSDIG